MKKVQSISIFSRIRQLCKGFPRVCAVVLGIGFSLVGLLYLELFCYVLNHLKPEEQSQFHYRGNLKGKYGDDDHSLGYKPPAKAFIQVSREVNQQLLYDVQYSFDEYHRRITPVRQSKSRKRFLLFFGGSFAFGEGVNDTETFPFYVGDQLPEYRPYNYAFHGYGPQAMLAMLEDDIIRKNVLEREGMLVYEYVVDLHVERAIGRMNVYTGWGANMPYYRFDSSRELQRQGNFTSGRPWLAFWYPLLARSQIVQYFDFNFPPRLTASHYKLTAAILSKARDLFRAQFQSDAFYVLIYPNTANQVRIIPYLEQMNLRYLNYSDLFEPDALEYHIEGDGHPSPKANSTLATRFVRDVFTSND